MELTAIPGIEPKEIEKDHRFVFDAHNHDMKQLITRYRGTVIQKSEAGQIITGWQKSIYHFGGMNREVPIVVTINLDPDGIIKKTEIDEQSRGSQGKRCDFTCLEALCNEKLGGTRISELRTRVNSAPDVKCLHLFEILSACASFHTYLESQGLQEGSEQEYIALVPDKQGLTARTTHEMLSRTNEVRIRLDHNTPPVLNGENLAESIDAVVKVNHNGEIVITEELKASDFEGVYAQLNRLFSKCQHNEKAYYGLKGRVKFSNWPSMTGLVLLTLSHSGIRGGVTRALKIEKILHYLQTGYGNNPCKGFGG